MLIFTHVYIISGYLQNFERLLKKIRQALPRTPRQKSVPIQRGQGFQARSPHAKSIFSLRKTRSRKVLGAEPEYAC